MVPELLYYSYYSREVILNETQYIFIFVCKNHWGNFLLYYFSGSIVVALSRMRLHYLPTEIY